MEIEFRSWLRAILQSPPFSEFIGTKGSGENTTSFDRFDVGICPFPEDGWFTTNLPIAFHASLEIELRKSVPTPPQIAEFFVSMSESNALPEMVPNLFHCKVGGPGHLNVFPSKKFLSLFLDAMLRAPDFFSRLDSRIVPSVSKLLPEKIDCDLIALQKLLARSEQRIIGNERDDRGSTELLKRFKATRSSDDAWMLLGVLSDEQIDVQPYLSGMFGSENIPWYLDTVRARAEAMAFTSTPSDQDVSELLNIGFPRMRFAGKDGDSDEARGAVLREGVLLERLALFRCLLASARRMRSPKQMFLGLLEICKAFSALYNRPEYRSIDSISHQRLRILAGPVHRAISECFGLIHFYCDE